MLYELNDTQRSNKVLLQNILILCAIALLPQIPAVILVYTARIEWLTITLSLAGVFAAIFYWGIWGSAAASYRRFLRDVTAGRSHNFTGVLQRRAQDSVREGVPSRTLYFCDDKDAQERLCYLDLRKDQPLQEGVQYTVTLHGQAIIGIEKA